MKVQGQNRDGNTQAIKVHIAPTVPNANTTTKLCKFTIKEALPDLPDVPVDDGPPAGELGTKVAEGLARHERAAEPAAPDALDAPVLMVALPEKLHACEL